MYRQNHVPQSKTTMVVSLPARGRKSPLLPKPQQRCDDM
jgi:hypothetical protein